MDSLFSVTVASSSKKAVSTTPEFQTTPSRGGIKINEAASQLVGIKGGTYMVLVSNFAQVSAAILQKDEALIEWAAENDEEIANYPVFWGIAKGYIEVDAQGTALQTPRDLSHKERETYIAEGKVDAEGKVVAELVDKYKGSKMSAFNRAAGFAILSGADSNNWAYLGGNNDAVITYEVALEPTVIANEYGDDMEVYALVNPISKDKLNK